MSSSSSSTESGPAEEHMTEEAEHVGEEDESEHSTDDEPHAQDEAAAKKKKKKKKKKKSPATGSGSTSDEAGAAGGDKACAAKQETAALSKSPGKQEAERRFNKALESAKQGEDMWVLLADANVHDAKVKKLFEALSNNSSITSVNLSANHIGDEGVQALVDVLQQGGCSELISLDLRGNSLSGEAQALLADLGKKRKQLAISTGPLPPPEEETSSSSSSGSSSGRPPGRAGRGGGRTGGRAGAGAAAGQQQQQQQQQPQQAWNEQSLQELVRFSPMFKRYFQTGEDDDAEVSTEEEAVQVEQVPPPEEVWAKVDELLPQGESSIPQLSDALVVISKALDAEMSSMPAHEEDARLEDFQPHFRAVIGHLPQLQQVLQLQPPPKICQSCRHEAQPAVGSHRVWACGILHMLLLHNNPVIDQAVADAGLLPTVMALALAHDRCSAVQCRAVEMLRSSLQSSVQDLWQGLFLAGYGQQIQQLGSSSGELVRPLHQALVDIASSAVQQPMGQRPCVTGFAVEVANTLLQGSDASNPEQLCSALVPILESCAAWQTSIAPDGAIHSLLKEQDGHLCGPPPPRPAPSVDSVDDESMEPSLGLMNGQIMALLSRMGELS